LDKEPKFGGGGIFIGRLGRLDEPIEFTWGCAIKCRHTRREHPAIKIFGKWYMV
jgi:hypothetical protein